MANFEGKLNAKGFKFCIVASRFNEILSKRLLEGAVDCLVRHQAEEKDIDVIWTPGSFEIPFAAKKAALSKKYDGIICLGVIIKGDTPHFEYIASEAAKGIQQVNLDTLVPASFGLITSDSLEQAIERAGSKSGNKGWQAALSAIEMVNLNKTLP